MKSIWLVLCAMVMSSMAVGADSVAMKVLGRCRAMLPVKPITLSGAITLRTRKGFVKGEYDYVLFMDRSKIPSSVKITLMEKDTTNVLERIEVKRPGPIPKGRVLGTDVAWIDLTLDFLWWPEAVFDPIRSDESIHGESCDVIRVSDGTGKTVRIWAAKDNGALMQAEELAASGEPLRRLWGTSIRKFGERWVPDTIEIETLGTHHRTKITVTDLKN